MDEPITTSDSSCACLNKPAAWCRGCPNERKEHCVDATITTAADLVVITDSKLLGRFYDVNKIHLPFVDDAERVITATMDRVKKSSPELSEVRVGYTYAVHCIDEDPGKDVIERCSKFLAASLANAAKESGRRPVLLVMGTAACKAAGIKTKKLADVQSRVLTTTIQDVEYTAVVTVSAKMVASMPGMFNIFESDATRAIKLAAMTVTGGTKDQPSLDELTKNYLLPTTVEGVRTLIDTVLSYGEDSDSWSIAIDTETNTKFPHRANAKIVAISVAWDTGKAGAFAMWHPNAPYNPEDLVPDVVRLLQSKKPKALHNAKFDLKMFARYGWSVENFAWDTMLVEHCLEEDKKGQYGLKQLTRVNFPEFGSYADELAEQKTKQEGDSQLENIRKQQRDAEADPLLTPTKKKAGKKKHADGGFENVDLGVLLKYAAVDTDMTRRLSLLQISRIKKEQAAYEQAKLLETRRRTRKYEVPNLPPGKFPVADAFRGISKPVVHELADMEMRGIRVDQDKVRFLDQELGKIIATAEQTLYGLAGTADLKLNSAAAVANVLFNHGYIDPATGRRVVHAPVSVTATGQAQTTEKVLKALVARSGCKFSAQKLIYAKAYKAKNTFIANVRDLSSLDGFLHTNYNQHGTATFRLSSNDENMQNIPKKLAGHSIKQIFVPDDDSYVLVNADAKGAEVRIFTAYSRDPDLIRSLNEGQDTHCFIGSRIVAVVRERPHEAKEVLAAIGLDDDYPLTYEDFAARDQLKQSRPAYGEMLDKFRTAVKRVVFGILYGAAAPKIAETIGISQDQAQQIIDLLFKLYPSIPRYMEQTKWELATFGMVETYFGRRRRFSVKSAPRYMLRRAERQAVNFKIQSTSSDIVMGRLVAAAKPLRYDVGGRMLLTVHDSLGFQWPKKYLNQLPEFIDKYLVKGAAEAHPWLPVAFNWDFEVGPNYGDLKPYEVYLKNHPTLIQQDLLEEAYGEDDIESDLKDADAE